MTTGLHTIHSWRPLLAALLVLAASLAIVVPFQAVIGPGASTPPGAGWDEGLPVEQWAEIRQVSGTAPYFRWTHSGAVHAASRDSLVLFGADSHLLSFDNSVYELRLKDLSWRRHQPPSPPWAMRTDRAGRRIAGIQQIQPWPTHIYDAMLYDPVADVVRVFAGDKHSFIPAPGAQFDPHWEYSLGDQRWRMAPEVEGGLPNFFAAGVTYDPARDTILGYASLAEATPFLPLAGEDEAGRTGVWELGAGRDQWRPASAEVHHWGWFNAEFDVAHGVMLVFGGSPGPGTVWAYTPGGEQASGGTWQRREPAGDDCPGGVYFPAAYDPSRRVTLIIPPARDGSRSLTCLYDYGLDRYTRLAGGDLPPLGLNYTLVYSPEMDVFVLLSGSFFEGEPLRIWALRLDPGRRMGSQPPLAGHW